MSNIPGLRCSFAPMSLFGALLPTFYLNPGLNWQWRWRNQVYSKWGLHTIAIVPYLGGTPFFYTRSLEVTRQVVSTKGQFVKAVEYTASLSIWGRNLFSENGAEWTRHRRILSPAFNPEMYAHVWEETVDIYNQMVAAEGWTDKTDHFVPVINKLTSKAALTLISRCAFGQPLSWDGPADSTTMPFGEALSIISATSVLRFVLPRWVYRLPIKRLRDIETAYTSLIPFMDNLIKTRREELSAEDQDDKTRKDVFRLMIRASESEGNLRMSDDELIGNTYLMLFAGQDTTAKTLDATIGFLALYEDIQEEIYQEVRDVMSSDGKLTYNNYSRLKKTQAAFLEGARLFPAAYVMIREAADDVVLTTDEEDGHGGQILIEAGTKVVVDVVGLHYNAKIFPEPEEFRPSRWYGAAENDMTMFSLGPRICIGRRFALAEGVAFLSHLLRDWKFHIVLNPGETRPEWRQRVMKGVATMSLGVGEVPVRLTRR
ncbi:cytochrome P450 [Mycena filopes]|nr:cytochrome P450 [Mycena filopes]